MQCKTTEMVLCLCVSPNKSAYKAKKKTHFHLSRVGKILLTENSSEWNSVS